MKRGRILRAILFAALFALFALFALMSGGCGGGGGGDGGGGGNDASSITPVIFEQGGDEIIVTQTIGQDGGTIAANGTGTPIDGVSAVFPPGALPGGMEVRLGYNNGTMTPNDGVYGGFAVLLNVGDYAGEFERPVSITVPFTSTDEDVIPLAYYIDPAGILHAMPVTEFDRERGTFTFATYHASLFGWIYFNTHTPDEVVATGFSPAEDGFKVANRGSVYNREGECQGMTSFSLWYFQNQQSTKGDFFPKYMTAVGKDSKGRELVGQNIIATRSFTSISQHWNDYYSQILFGEEHRSKYLNFSTIRGHIKNTGYPVMLSLRDSPFTKSGHSVLAYAYRSYSNGKAGEISVCDPNYPGEERKIEYLGGWGGSFAAYDLNFLFKSVTYSGDGAIQWTERYDSILDDADANFHDEAGAKIEVNSHSNGDDVDERNVTLSGKIESGEVLVEKLFVYVGSRRFSGNVSTADGSFSIPVSLEWGENHLRFEVYGRDSDGYYMLDPLPNDMETEDFVLNCEDDKSIILVTLTWDTNDSDVDLYVIDPSGDYSCYYHKTTSGGGELDHDITNGYGPEHWTLTTSDTIQYGAPYRIRLHYYDDGDGDDENYRGTNYTLTYKLYEGTDREETRSFRGYLGYCDSDNDSPSGAGADWYDVASIVLTEEESASASRSPASSQPDGTAAVNISEPVPPRQERIAEKIKKIN
jgi:hypothetical protein